MMIRGLTSFTLCVLSSAPNTLALPQRRVSQAGLSSLDQSAALQGIYESTGMASGSSRQLHNWFSERKNGSDYCTFTGVDCDDAGVVTELRLNDLALSGTFPSSVIGLSGLVQLHLDNNGLVGEIPPTLSTLSHLRVLNLGYNTFVGAIPSLNTHTDIRSIRLEHNALEGTVPSALCSFPLLRTLDFSGNFAVHGNLPDCLGNLSSLTTFQLHSTSITGSIPSELCELREMNGLSPNTFGCDAIGCAAGNFQKLRGRQWSNGTMCEPCTTPSNVIGSTFCRWLPADEPDLTYVPTTSPVLNQLSEHPSLCLGCNQTVAPSIELVPSLAPVSSSDVPSEMVPSSLSPTRQVVFVKDSHPPSSMPLSSASPVTPESSPPVRDLTPQPTGVPSRPVEIASEHPTYWDSNSGTPVLLASSIPTPKPSLGTNSISSGNSQASSSKIDKVAVGSLCVLGFFALFTAMFFRLQTLDKIDEPTNGRRDEPVLQDATFSPPELYCIEEEGSIPDDIEWPGETRQMKSCLKSPALLLPRSGDAKQARRPTRKVRFDLPLDHDKSKETWTREKEKQQAVSKSAARQDTVHWALWIMNNDLCSACDSDTMLCSKSVPSEEECSCPPSPSSDSSAANSTTPILNDDVSSEILFGWDTSSVSEEMLQPRKKREPLLGIASRDLDQGSRSVAYSEPAPKFLRDVTAEARQPSSLSSVLAWNPLVRDTSSGTVVSEETYHDTDDRQTPHPTSDEGTNLVEV